MNLVQIFEFAYIQKIAKHIGGQWAESATAQLHSANTGAQGRSGGPGRRAAARRPYWHGGGGTRPVGDGGVARSDTGRGSLGQQWRRRGTRTRVVKTARVVSVGQPVGMMGLYPRQWRWAVPPCSANRSKALHNTDDDKWARA
jgi:hypothetical protein